jgi:type IV secretion system protein VirB11
MTTDIQTVTSQERHTAMLRTAFCAGVCDALEDPATIEIMANPDGSVWIEQAGSGIARSGFTLTPANRERIIRLVAASLPSSHAKPAPIVTAELPGSGERFEGLLPPVATAPCFSIRKASTTDFTLERYAAGGGIAPDLALALRAAVAGRANILIAGGTSSGKTTLANALLREDALAPDRIVLLEDTRELRAPGENTLCLRTLPGQVSLQDLVRSTLRLRPDRIIVGEVRGGESLDLLKAWNTGHPGGITTLHANSARGALHRLEQLTAEATHAPPRELIGEAIDVVVFMSRTGGARRVEEALRVSGFDSGRYLTEPLVPQKPSLVRNGDLS